MKKNMLYCWFAGMALCGLSFPATSGLITVGFDDGPPPPNDCPGEFETGQGFESCEVNGSPVIAKYNADGTVDDINEDDFPSIDGSEFTLLPDDGSAGSWTYTQGQDDPQVRYWSAKGGNQGFNLFYYVPDEYDAECAGSFESSCLDRALARFSGEYFTPSGGLSHLTFYDTEGEVSVPEPGTLALLGVGLLGIAGASRRRRA